MRSELNRPQPNARRMRSSLLVRFRLVLLALLLLPAYAYAQGGGAPLGNPRLASLNIEIWPEYDRPAALVIVNAVLAEGVKLPAAVTLRLPLASGGASAVAFAAAADGKLLNLKHESATAGEFIAVKFDVPDRYFHVEFYEPIVTTAPTRNYRYLWPGDFAADRVTVVVQEPASSTAVSVEPNLDRTSTGREGLNYRAAELGALAAGKALPIAVRYTKTDARPSAEILKPVTSAAAVPAAATPAAPGAAPAAGAATTSSAPPGWIIALMVAVILAMLGGVSFMWWRQRHPAAAQAATPPQHFCAKCGATQAPESRFCASCGAKVK